MDLAAFRAAYPPQTLSHAGDSWEYIRAGAVAEEGNRTLLILPGALSVAEASWIAIAHFADPDAQPRFDVLAPTYPATIYTMSRLSDGISALLDHLEVHAAAVFGASYGGLVAQSLARRHPNHVERLILSHTGAPNPERADRTRRSMSLLRRIPVPILKSMYRRQFARAYREIDHPVARASADHMEEIVSQRLTRESIVNIFLRVADFDETWDAQPSTPYPGPTLLLFGAEDDATPAQERERIHALYPQAEVTTFKHSGHASAITEADAFYARLDSFLIQTTD